MQFMLHTQQCLLKISAKRYSLAQVIIIIIIIIIYFLLLYKKTRLFTLMFVRLVTCIFTSFNKFTINYTSVLTLLQYAYSPCACLS